MKLFFQISVSDIDFLNKETEVLKLMEEKGTYPPRFHVVITCLSPAAATDNITIIFKGAANSKDLEFPMSLIPSPVSLSKWPKLGCETHT